MFNRLSFYCFALLLLLFSEDLLAQRIIYSSPQRLSGRNIGMRILGETSEGILVYKAGRKDDEMDVYGRDLRLKDTRKLSFPCNTCYAHRFVLMHDKVIVFVLEQERNYSVIHYREYNARMEPVSRLIALDTIKDARDAVYDNFTLSFSEDKSYIYYAHPYYENRQLKSVIVSGFSSDMEYVFSDNIPYQGELEHVELHSLVVSNKGNFYLTFEGYENVRRNRSNGNFFLYGFNKSENILSSYLYQPDDKIFGRTIFRMDNFNEQLVAVSLIEYENAEGPRGVSFLRVDDKFNHAYLNRVEFPGSIIYDISGRDSIGANLHILNTFNLYNVIMRYDGGFVVIAESRYDNTEAFRGSMITPSMSPGYRSVNVNYFNDIILMSVDKNGNLDWSNVLRKKQISEDDRGFFSSYAVVLTPDRLRLVFNEEIYIQTNINEYRVDPTGEVRRNNIFNSGERNVMLAPRLANQINANTLVIPSFRRNNFRLVKIEY